MTAYKEDALPMTDQEIAQSYREAKNPAYQVEIIAQLCGVEREVILDALERQGVRTACKRRPGAARKVNYTLVAELYGRGANDNEIARQLGLSHCTVNNWRNERGLPPHRKHSVPRSRKGVAK